MAEPISIQQLKDASEDAITLADFIYKPANVMIPRRLAADINSLQYYLDYMSSYAQHSYETYDEMVANAPNLPNGVSAFVTNDLDTAKNGLYTYNGVSFVKGDYQPENAAKELRRDIGAYPFEGSYSVIDSFELGATITQRNQALRHTADGKLYRWAGDLPKAVPSNSTPTSSGGMGDNAWLEVSGVALWQDLANPDMGAAMVARGVVAVDSIADLLALSEEQRKEGLRYLVKGYHVGSDVGGGEFYYDPARRQENDSGSVLNGFVRIIAGHVTPTMFGARGDGVTDDTDSINRAIALAGQFGTVVFPDGGKSFLISSELVMLQGQQWEFEGGQRASKLLKGYNGNVIKTSSLGRLISPFVDGNGATYTGTNIVIPSGTFSPYLENVRTVSSQGAGVLFEKNAGGGAQIVGIEGDTTSPETVGVIKLTEDTTAVPRFFSNVYLSGGVLDFTGGGNGTSVTGFYIRNLLTGYVGSTRSAIFKFANGRFANLGGTTKLTAADGLFTSTTFATTMTLDDCQGVAFDPSCIITNVVELPNSRFNSFYKAGSIYPVVWSAADGSLGDFGNSKVTAVSSRVGQLCVINLNIVFGSTFTPPSGSNSWGFSLPYKGFAVTNQKGIFAEFYDSTAVKSKTFYGSIGAKGTDITFGLDGQGVRNGFPKTVVAGDSINATFQYLVD